MAKIRIDLSFMDRKQVLYRLQLQEQRILHNQVCPIDCRNDEVLVRDAYGYLLSHGKTVELELSDETNPIGVLEQARSKVSMNLYCATNCPVAYFVEPRSDPLLFSSFFFAFLPFRFGLIRER